MARRKKSRKANRGTLPPPGGSCSPPVPLARRWHRRVMSDDQLLEERVEHRPSTPTCADCRHLGGLGDLIRVTDGHGARRFRRRCLHCPLGFTDPSWPVCAAFEATGGGGEAMERPRRPPVATFDPDAVIVSPPPPGRGSMTDDEEGE
jgi:hypothetical protein